MGQVTENIFPIDMRYFSPYFADFGSLYANWEQIGGVNVGTRLDFTIGWSHRPLFWLTGENVCAANDTFTFRGATVHTDFPSGSMTLRNTDIGTSIAV